MKTLALLFLVLACTASCTKKYDCVCEIRTFDNGQLTTDNVTSEIKAKKKANAEAECMGFNDSTNLGNYYTVTDCILK
jgi:hypothetical protein